MHLTRKFLSFLLIGTLTFGSIDIPAKAADYATDESSASLSVSYENMVSSSGALNSTEDASDILIFDEDDDEEAAASTGSASSSSASASSEYSSDESSFDYSYDESDAAASASSDEESDAASSASSEEESDAASSASSEDSSEAASSASSAELPEELPDNFYTEYPTGGVINIEPLEEIESVSVGRRRLLRSAGYEDKYTTENLPGLRDQSPYGSCWAFATTALAEISLMNNGTMDSADMSELHLAYFTYNSVTDPLGGTAGDVATVNDTSILNFGGRIDWGLATFSRWIGVAEEGTANYKTDAVIANRTGLNSSLAYTNAAHVVNYYQEPISHDADEIENNLHANLKEMIKRYGAIGIEFYAYNSMSSSFDATIYNVEHNSYYNPNAATPNHAVTIVGWDDTFSKDNFATPAPGDGAFLVRNSWMDGTGTDKDNNYAGYFWMSYYEATLGSTAYAGVFDLASNYDNNYEYDGGLVYGGLTADKTANVFYTHAGEGDAGEELKAVAFYTYNSNVSYKITVYTGLTDPTNPESGTKATTKSGTTEYAGYHTIGLNEIVTLDPDTTFSVVVELTKDGKNASMGVEASFTYADVEIQEGQSFYYNGSNWIDKTNDSYDGNIAIKAFTNNITGGAVATGLEVTGLNEDGTLSVSKNGNALVGVKFSPTDTANKRVTWTSSNPNIATVSQTGVVRGVSKGQTTITVQSVGYPEVSASFKVNVVIGLVSIDIATSDMFGDAFTGKTYHFSAYPYPREYTTTAKPIWSTSTPEKVSVNATTGAYTILKAGVFDVTVTLEGITRSLSFTAYPGPNDYGYEINDDNSVTIWWNGIPDARFYRIYFDNGEYTDVNADTEDSAKRYELTDTTYQDDFSVKSATYGYGFVIGDTLYTVEMPVTFPARYNITYVLNGGTQNENNPETYRKGKAIELLAPTHPQKGYVFEGWYKDAAFKTKKNSITTTDSGNITLYAKFSRTNMSKAEIEGFVDSFNYNGSDCRQDASLYMTLNNVRTELIEGEDYTVSYSTDIKNVGNKVATYTGINGFTGSFSKSYKIVRDIGAYGMKLNAAGKAFTYNANNFVTTFTVTDDQGKALRAGVDYDTKTVTYTYAQDCKLFDGSTRTAGQAAVSTDIVPVDTVMIVTVSGMGFYSGSIAGEYTITEGDMAKAAVKVNKLYLDGGIAKLDHSQLEVKIGTTILGTDDYKFTSAGNTNNVVIDDEGKYVEFTAKGTYRVAIEGTGKFSGSKVVSLTVADNPARAAYIVFVGNGYVTGSMANVKVGNVGATINLPANKFVRRGYKFTGWASDPAGDTEAITDADGTVIGDTNSIEVTASLKQTGLVLYAQWETVEYTITYHHNGVPSDDHFGNRTSYNTEDEKFSIIAPDTADWPTGYQFGGWYTDTAYKNRIYQVAKGSAGDLDLYAKWVPYTYTVHFHANGPANAVISGSMPDQVFSYGVDKALLANAFTRKGYAFMGWSEDPTADYNDIQFANKEVVSNIVVASNNVNGEKDLYAIWASEFTYSLNANGGTLADKVIENLSLSQGDAADIYLGDYTYGVKAITMPTPVRAGYVFGGWFTYDVTEDEESGNSEVVYLKQVKSIAKNSTGDYDLIAKWTPYAYTIAFNGNGNNSGKMTAQKASYGKNVTLTTNSFAKKGYVFEGWSTNKNYANTQEGVLYADGDDEFSYVPTKNGDKVTLYAIWSEDDHHVFYMDGAQEIDQVEYVYGQGLTTLLDPSETYSKPGFKFMGWYSDAGFKKKVTSIAKSAVGDIVLYARYDMTQNYTVVFNPDIECFDGEIATQSINYTTSTALARNKYVKEGYAFVGWSEISSGEVLYTDGQKILRPDEALLTEEDGKYTLTLYAVWKNEFDITYMDGNQVIDNGSYTYIQGLAALPDPEKEGYEFIDWYYDAKFRTKVNIADFTKANGDKTLYAKWRGVRQYTVEFNANEPDGVAALKAMKNQALVYGTAKALTKTSYKISGCTFLGWTTDADSNEIVYKNGEKILDPTDYLVEEDDKYILRLYAVWNVIPYSIEYRNVDQEFVENNPSGYTVSDRLLFEESTRKTGFVSGSNDLVIAEPERMGETFLGWYSDAKFKKKVTSFKVNEIGNKTLYAKWSSIQYTIRYDLNEGQYSVYPASLDTTGVGYINSYNLTYDSGYRLATATREGYTFGGWYKDTKLKTKVGPIISSPTVDMTVYAKWIPDNITYSIHFESNGDQIDKATGSMRDMTLKFGSVYSITKATFKRPNYTFDGWNTAADGSGTAYINSQKVRDLTRTNGEKITLYAQWKPVTYTIKYSLNGGRFESDAVTSYVYGQEAELPVPVKTYYDFEGWYLDSAFTASKKITSITSTTSGNKTLFAKFTLNEAKLFTLPDEYLNVQDFGAIADDGRSDKAAIKAAVEQAGYNYSHGGVTAVYFPAGVYNLTPEYNYEVCIGMWTGVQLYLDDNAILKVGYNDCREYAVIGIKNVDDVVICGGQIDGNRDGQPTKGGEWGHGVGIYGSRNIFVANMDIYNNWGDGVYLGTQAVRQPDNRQKYMGCKNVLVSGCEIHRNRRNGISLTDADDTTIKDCNIYDSYGAAPQCGIYIEPNSDSSDKVCERLVVKNTVITAYQRRNDPEYMCFMTHYDPNNLSYVTARDVKFIGCTMNGYFGNYSGLKMTFSSTRFNGTVTNLKANM